MILRIRSMPLCVSSAGNSPDAVVCINCNGWLKRKCPSCGYENDARVTICANCRERLAEPKKIKPW
ncbi:MAG: zinc-ribbon domain-containing protein [Lachnospiraceae bacterium]|nr:zinc-ribbon domain-containing protein [Lachnospiraceae bacterium]